MTLPLHTAGSLAALAELGLLPLLKNANVASQEEIFHDVQQKLHADLAKTIRHASGGLPDARNVSDVDVALHTRTPRDLLAQFPKGTTVSHDVHRSMYAIPGYTRPVNVYATSDPALAQRGQRHRDTELTLASQFPQLETQARALKQQGLSTEKAWATILELPGDPYEAMLDKATVLQRAAAMAKHAAAFAPGIPQSKPIARLPTITPKTLNRWVMAVQEHEAERAGKHYDLRLVDPDSGKAHSWAIPKAKLPVPGEQLLAIQTFTHTPEYALHFGEKKPQTIGQGYGKGRVWMALKEPTDIIESSNDHVRFNVYQGKDINEYLLHRTHDNKWLIRNTTVTKDTADVPQSRPKYKETTPDKVDVSDPSHLMMAKIDGAHNTFRLDAGGPVRIFSYRPTERNTGIIEHTHRFVPGLTARVPSHLDGLVLRGELFAADPHTGRAREAVETGAVLNSGVWKSRDTQQHSPLRAIVFDVARRKGQNVESLPYQEKLDILKKVHAALPFLELPPMANTTKEKVTLLNRIRTGQEPTTREGVVLWPLKGGAPIKAKFKPDHDVYVREIFPEQGARGEMAGGFAYSWSPTGKIVGRVGTGFDFTLKKDMLENPEKYIGRVARVEAQSVYRDKTSPKKPGALRAPAFKDWHLDKGMQPLEKTAVNRLVRYLESLKKMPQAAELALLPEELRSQSAYKLLGHKAQGLAERKAVVKPPTHTYDVTRRIQKTLSPLQESDPDIYRRGVLSGLLHDVGKAKELKLKGRVPHAELGAQRAEKLLRKNPALTEAVPGLDQGQLADVVRAHNTSLYKQRPYLRHMTEADPAAAVLREADDASNAMRLLGTKRGPTLTLAGSALPPFVPLPASSLGQRPQFFAGAPK